MLVLRFSPRFSASSSLRRYGFKPQSLPVLPQIDFPIREYVPGEKQIPKEDIHRLVDYKKKEFPRCRYFAYEHKGQIYHVYDSSRYPFGRMINRISTVIRGKDTPLYKNNEHNKGQIAIIVNAQDPLFTGKKLLNKELIYHTGFVGHLKRLRYKDILLKRPQLLYYYSVSKFLPKNKLRRPYLENIYVFRGRTHDFSFLPQFAPDKNIYEGLPEVNLMDMVKDPVSKISRETAPGLIDELLDHTFERDYKDPLVEVETKQEMVFAWNDEKIANVRKQHLRKMYRYLRVGAIRKRVVEKRDFQYFDSEKEARKSPHWDILQLEEINEDEEEIVKSVYPVQGEEPKPASKVQETKSAAKGKSQDPKKK